MDIKTKAELLDAMRSNPTARLHGMAGSRPSTRWTYTLKKNGTTQTVSLTAVNAIYGELLCLSSHFMCTKHKLK